MGDKGGGDMVKKQQHSSSPKDPLEETRQQQQQQSSAVVVTTSSFVSAGVYVPSGGGSSAQCEERCETVNTKRPRYGSGQWKLLPSPSSQHQQRQQPQMTLINSESIPSPSNNPQVLAQTQAASSSPTASSPPHSPIPSFSAASGQYTTSKPENEQSRQPRKGKYVSPAWKPNEMLWLARAWRVQYQSGSDGSGSSEPSERQLNEDRGDVMVMPSTRGKSRAEKDREVAEFLNSNGINRDARTAGTKWDNMLGEFRKVYEWEKNGEREKVSKSYFRLSPYERKIHRLPASFDEGVYEELSQFMGLRMRNSQSRGAALVVSDDNGRTAAAIKPLPPPPPFKEDDLSLSARTKQQAMVTGIQAFFHGGRGSSFGFDSSFDGAATSSSSKEFRRIGKIRMIWEESVSLWAEEGECQRGRIKLQGTSFLNADELTFLDDTMVGCTMESFEEGLLRGFSVDRFICGQQVKVFGRRKSAAGFSERVQPPLIESSIRSNPPWEYQDPSEYYVGCLRVPPTSLPTLFELSWQLQEPPSEDLRFPLRRDVYRDLPQGKELFFTISSELLDCRAFTFDIVSAIVRSNPSISGSTATCRDSFISLWDDCINRVISKFCPLEVIIVRKVSCSMTEMFQDQWPNVTGFVRNFCLWRGEETDQVREGYLDPSSSIVEKLLWTYTDLPYILGYYAIGCSVTFCAMSRSQDRVIRTDLYSVDLSIPTERLKALVPCWRIAGLLSLLAERCINNINISNNNNGHSYKQLPYSDFERIDLGGGNIIEMTPNTVKRLFSNRRKWGAVKEIYDFLDHRIPHAEYICRASEKDLALILKPRGCKSKPMNCEQLVEALKFVTKALVALHDLSFMHRDLGWDKVMKRTDRENEWFISGFDEAVGAPQIYPHGSSKMVAGGCWTAPEMMKGLHGVKVDVWGVGQLVKTCGLVVVPKLLRDLQNKCLDLNPEQRPTAADCYHHLIQLQSSLSSAAGGF